MDVVSFGTDGWRATLDAFTDERVRDVGRAVAGHLRDRGRSGPVVVGYDARESSPGFAESLAGVFAAEGFEALLPERDVPTPVAAHAVVDRDCAGAVMVTASHNPPEYNGVKFIPSDGAPALPAVTDDIESRLGNGGGPGGTDAGRGGRVHRIDPIPAHREAVLSVVGTDLDGLAVAYDAIHGSGRGVTDAILAAAGADVRRLRCSRDPAFGGTSPDPSPENLRGLRAVVADGDADVGVATDGDADRVAVVTPDGPLGANLLFAATYDGLLDGTAGAGPTARSGAAVRSVSTTSLVDRVAAAHGEETVETPVGFKWIAAAMRDHGALIGGEESGGFALRGHVREKDGPLAALLAAATHAAEPLDDRVDRLFATHGETHTGRRDVDCPEREKASALEALAGAVPGAVAGTPVEEVVTLDGVKLFLADGSWLLVRPSGTEPMVRVYAEAGSDRRVAELLDAGRGLVASAR